MKIHDLVFTVFVMVLWGLNFIAAKLGIEEIPPIFLIGLRFTLVALLLVWFVRPPWEKMGRIVALSVTLGGLHFSLMFTGMKGVDASTAAVAIQLQVPFAAALSVLVYKDTLGWRRLLGMALAFIGIVFIAGEPRVTENLGSLALILVAAMVWAVANIQTKEIGAINGFALNAWIALLAAPQLFISSFLFEQNQWQALRDASWIGWSAVLYMAVFVTIIGYGLWYRLLALYPINQLMPFTLLVPVFGILAGVLVLGDPLTWRIMLGSVLTVAGVGVIVLRRPRLVDPNAESSR